MEKAVHANGNQKKDGVEILISDKSNIKAKTRDKEEHYIMIKGSVQQEDVTVVNIYVYGLIHHLRPVSPCCFSVWMTCTLM